MVMNVTSTMYAWTYSFSNHTSKVIAVGITYQNDPQSFEFKKIKPKKMDRFKPGDPGISAWKKSFIVDHFSYLVNPATITEDNKLELPWKTATLTWVPSTSYNTAIDLSETEDKQGLATLLSDVGTSDGLTMAASRHIDIIEDENDNIHFIILLQP